jgi:hypothetical protein
MTDPMIKIFTDMSEYLTNRQLADVIFRNCPDDQYGSLKSDVDTHSYRSGDVLLRKMRFSSARI